MMHNNVVSPEELIKWTEQKEIQIIDLSNDNLMRNSLLNYTWIPVHDIFNKVAELKKEIPVVLCCRVGADSFFCMNILATDYHMDNVFSLQTGITGLQEYLKINISK